MYNTWTNHAKQYQCFNSTHYETSIVVIPVDKRFICFISMYWIRQVAQVIAQNIEKTDNGNENKVEQTKWYSVPDKFDKHNDH